MYSSILSLLNLNALEENRYTVLTSQGPFEVRFYPRMTCAKIALPGDFKAVLKEGLFHLEEYLSGNNFKVTKIECNSPYFHSDKVSAIEVGIILPSSMNAMNAPKPINRFVKIEEIPPGRVGVLKFKGSPDETIYQRRSEELKKWLSHKGFFHSGPYRGLRLEFGLDIPFYRQNEVHFDLI